MSKFLVGKTIKEMKIADDKQAILFICDDGEHVAKCDADCCSYTWVESIEFSKDWFPCKVIEACDIDMPEEDYELIAFYGFKIITDKGHMVIDYRNESNGYYGGSLEWPDSSYFYGGVYNQNVSNEKWIDIDFQ